MFLTAEYVKPRLLSYRFGIDEVNYILGWNLKREKRFAQHIGNGKIPLSDYIHSNQHITTDQFSVRHNKGRNVDSIGEQYVYNIGLNINHAPHCVCGYLLCSFQFQIRRNVSAYRCHAAPRIP